MGEADRWPRVTRRGPCSICGQPDWCQVSPDGKVAKCMRSAAGSFRSGESAVGEFHLHHLLHHPGERQSGAEVRSVWAPAVASAGLRHRAFSTLLEALELSPSHAENLLARGLDEEAITRNLYSTAMPARQMEELIAELAGTGDLSGIPGFELRGGRWTLAVKPGELLIPVRDYKARVVALRRRTTEVARRYLWASSPQASSGAPPHHSEPWNAEQREVIVITEGELKADVVSCKLSFTTIGLPGCGSVPAGFTAELAAQYPHVKTLVTAFDSDTATNPAVARARQRLEELLFAAGYRVLRYQWSAEDGKGLDDVLAQMAS